MKHSRKITRVFVVTFSIVCVIVATSVQSAIAQSLPTFFFKFGSFGNGNGQFVFTFGVAKNNADDIIVVDFGNHRVQVFDASGNFLFKFGSFGFGNGQFRNPTGVAVNSLDNIIVVDSPNHRVQVFDPSGNFLFKFGSFGGGNGFFIGPQGVAVNSADDIIVVDRNNRRIQVFDSSGNFKFKFGSLGSGDGQFDFPYGVAVDGSDNIIVSDRNSSRIQKFDLFGNYLFKFGSLGSGDGQFDNPYGVAVDNSENIIVVDANNHRVQVFDPSGNFLFKFASLGSGDGQFNQPRYISVNSAGNIIITDSNNHRVQVFSTLVPLSAFTADVEIELGPGVNDDEFEVKGSFTLGGASDGIDPLTEDVTLEVGTFSTIIPAGSFVFKPAKPGKPAQFKFEGVIGGVDLEVKIIPLGGNVFDFKAEGEGADLTGTTNPVEVTLVIGDDTGTTSVTAEIKVDDDLDKTIADAADEGNLPDGFVLFQNHPNPFNPETEIRFQLPEVNHVLVKIYNMRGEQIRMLVDAQYKAGNHKIGWDGKDNNENPVSSGVYLYQIKAGAFSKVKKMTLIR